MTAKTDRPAELKPEHVTAICDTREQLPLDLFPLLHVVQPLPTGDYSVVGMENIIAVERKSEGDLLACCGRERERFDREVQRLMAYPVRALIVESTWQRLERGEWRSQLKPQHVIGSLIGWITGGLPVIMASDHDRAGKYTARILFIAARRRWRELRSFTEIINDGTTNRESITAPRKASG